MKKKVIVILSITLVIVLVGIFAARFAISFVFDEYILKTALSSVTDKQEPVEDVSGENIKETTEELEKEKEDTIAETDNEEVSGKKRLEKTEIINKVMQSSELTNKMAAMVPYAEKKKIIQIILSNFTEAELNEMAKKASGGFSSTEKSQLIRTVQSRMSHAQWMECLNIAYKYIDQMRPYVE